MYLNIAVSLFLIPLLLNGAIPIRLCILAYVLYMAFSTRAIYYPSIVILLSYMSEAYVIYLAIILIGIIKYKTIKLNKLNGLFNVLFILLLIAIYSIVSNKSSYGIGIGLVLNQYQLYLSFFAFIYGALIAKDFDRAVVNGLIVSLLLLYLINYYLSLYDVTANIRIIFYIMPFIATLAYYYAFVKKEKYSLFYVVFLVLLLVIQYNFITFTLLFTSFASIIVVRSYFNKKVFAKAIMSVSTIMVLSSLIAVSIITNRSDKYTGNTAAMNDVGSMSDIHSFSQLLDRLSLKLFVDRGDLWASVWEDAFDNYNVLPPKKIKEITIHHNTGQDNDFEFHAHNVILEILRNDGIIFTFVLFCLFTLIFKKSTIFLSYPPTDSLLSLLAIVSLSNYIMGSISGIYVFLSSYALLGVGLLGVIYSKSINNTGSLIRSAPFDKI